MTDVKGVLTTLNHALPAGVDATRLAQWRLREGRSYEQVRAELTASLDGLNEELVNRWGDIMFITTEDHMEYPNGGALEDMPDVTDLDRYEPHKGTTVGHMIDLRVKGAAIGGTHRFFRDAREATLVATIRDHAQRGRNTFEKALLTRAMTDNENLLGTSGYDVGFASASASVSYAPPAYGGQTFLTTHTHYVGVDSNSLNHADLIEKLAETVTEHADDGYKLIAYIAEADASTYMALDNFVKLTNNNIFYIDMGGATSGNQFFSRGELSGTPQTGGRLIGYYQSPYGQIELRSTRRIPTKYASVFRSYGVNDPRNPLAVRVHPDVGFGFYIKEIPSYDTTWPVKAIEFEIEYGISCGMDRTAGAAGYLVSGGVWVDPTIS